VYLSETTKGQGIMSMLEKMARRLALDALERVQPDTFTNVIDTIDLTKNEDGNYQVGERISYGDKNAPWLDYDAARDTMVAMMAAQAGAIVVVPEDAPMGSHLAHIAKLLVDSADVPTDAQDVADGAAIVQTVKNALDWLAKARGELREALAKVQHSNADFAAASNQANNFKAALDLCREEQIAAQKEIGALTAKLEEARRSIKRNVDEAANCQARYEAMTEALSLAMDKLAGVGK